MKDDNLRPEINMAKIPVDGGIAGLIFAVGSMAVFLVGIPSLRYLLPAAVAAGCGFALFLRLIPHEMKAPPSILSWCRGTGDKSSEA